MKKLILIILLLITLSSYKVYKMSDAEKNYYCIKQEIQETKSGNSERKLHCVYKYADMYNIEPVILHRLILTESSWREWAENKNTGALGLGQILPKWWNHLLWHVDNGRLGKHIQEKNIKHTKRYYKRIGYGTEMTACIMSNMLFSYDTYPKALYVYGGYRKKTACKKKYTWYTNSILGE